MDKGIPTRQRRCLTAAALLPAGVGILKLPVLWAGRLAWLCPLVALPAGLALCWVWKGTRASFPGKGLWGRLGAGACLIWGTVLLWGSAAGSAERLMRTVSAGGRRWAVLLVGLLLTLYLTRRPQTLARAGKLFFPAVAVLVLGVLLLALPALSLDNLLPVSREELKGVPGGAAWVLSLSGYVAYAAFLPAGKEERGGWTWCLWACVLLSGLLLAVLGAFGPALALRMDQPFLYLLEGVGVPGAFQRGEALLTALAALGDLALLGLLSHSCGALWNSFFGGGGWFPTVVGFFLAVFAAETGMDILTGEVSLWGNPALGTGIPVIAAVTGKKTIFSGQKSQGKANVGSKKNGKKSCGKNAKKC